MIFICYSRGVLCRTYYFSNIRTTILYCKSLSKRFIIGIHLRVTYTAVTIIPYSVGAVTVKWLTLLIVFVMSSILSLLLSFYSLTSIQCDIGISCAGKISQLYVRVTMIIIILYSMAVSTAFTHNIIIRVQYAIIMDYMVNACCSAEVYLFRRRPESAVDSTPKMNETIVSDRTEKNTIIVGTYLS